MSFEDKIQNPDTPGGANLKYSVLDKMVNIPSFFLSFLEDTLADTEENFDSVRRPLAIMNRRLEMPIEH